MNKRVIEEYKQTKPSGFDNKVDLAYWAARASENSNTWKRAKDGEVKLHDTAAGSRSK